MAGSLCFSFPQVTLPEASLQGLGARARARARGANPARGLGLGLEARARSGLMSSKLFEGCTEVANDIYGSFSGPSGALGLNALLDCLVCRFLGSLAGGQKKDSQQKEIATDLSKFLHFSSSGKIDINTSVDVNCVEEYVEELRRRRIGPSGVISKLNTLCFAQSFIVQR